MGTVQKIPCGDSEDCPYANNHQCRQGVWPCYIPDKGAEAERVAELLGQAEAVKGGDDSLDNLQVLCCSCNSSKGNTMPDTEKE